MTMHVDFVRNNMDRHVHQLVGRAVFVGGRVETQQVVKEWDYSAVVDNALRLVTEAHEDLLTPEQLLEEVGQRYGNAYIGASNPHDESDCPFLGRDEIPMQETPIASGTFRMTEPSITDLARRSARADASPARELHRSPRG